jgi:hypothetical protein
MSALAKPCFYFSTAQGTGQSDVLINAESLATVEKVDVPAFGNTAAKSQILVVVNGGGAGSTKVFTFVDETARNTAFTALKALIGASV